MLILTETSAGYALLKAKDKKVLDSTADLLTPEKVLSSLKVKAFSKFDSAISALDEVNAIIDGKVSTKLANLLAENAGDKKKTKLIVADPKLGMMLIKECKSMGNAINSLPDMSFKIISDSTTQDLYRTVRENLPSLLPGLQEKDLSVMSLGLAHSLGRHKLKFSADKVDIMIVQAIGLLDDLDKELNTYAMRVKEWFGWHFPEMAKIVQDNIAYARVIKLMGFRSRASETDFSSVLPEEIEQALKAAAEVSMGTEITQFDLDNINALADQVVDFSEYREQLSNYLNARMAAIAPNLTALVGELVGARLIAHAGSLISLAKAPASTIQILGAEKALFRALKTKHDTPKYGIIYHASLIGQATGRNKGKIARMLAAKAAISLRFDALAEDREDVATIGLDSRVQIESRLRGLEGREITTMRTPVNVRQQPKFEFATQRAYNINADAVTNGISKKSGKRKIEEIDSDEDEVPAAVEVAAADESDEDEVEQVEEKKDQKEKKEKRKEKNEKVEKKEKQEKKDKKEKKEKKDKKEKKHKKHKTHA
ncbi:hypothetical protein LIPSTDRAFT_64146 [Lipomyces starkeyi NRRL Y-11557]|uniref:Nucleolar protein 58 n=1 Tax=Lipomyces starkeyi NRRL Y-11557 TaxID=675824 RepID=A0A1E3Q2L0_LIPST|nr:hypothetical protein LIPSTDRAFT_64146 [Lipomyces starkeyi NRRL Y-11557]